MAPSITSYAWLSVGLALATIGLKAWAWWLTGSVGLLSDAVESVVNLVAALFALFMVGLARRPPDEEHAYGHAKAEYFASGFEGALILFAAGSIVWAAVGRMLDPVALERWGLGVAVGAVATGLNVAGGWILMRAARRFRSIALEADAEHLYSDVFTSVAVLSGVVATALSGVSWLDPLVALGVALNVFRIGFNLVRRSLLGLIDTALPADTRAGLDVVLERYRGEGVDFHALRTRQSGFRGFVSMHVLVPGAWSVQRGHDLLERLEGDIRAVAPDLTVFTHLEPAEDPASWHDTGLDRSGEAPERRQGAADRRQAGAE